MKAVQKVQSRSQQTAAVVHNHVPTLTIANLSASDLLASADGLDALVQNCIETSSNTRQAKDAMKTVFLGVRDLDLRLPHVAEKQLRGEIPAEAMLLELLPAMYAIKPRTPNNATARARKLVAALAKIDAYLATLTPQRPAISVFGKGRAELVALIASLPKLEQDLADVEGDERAACRTLRLATRDVDRLNKRFYKALSAEARTDSVLAAALGQITTERTTRRPRAAAG